MSSIDYLDRALSSLEQEFEEEFLDEVCITVMQHVWSLGDKGDSVRTAIHPLLMKKHDLTPAEAVVWRRKAMRQLTFLGWVKRDGQGHNLVILKERPWGYESTETG